MLFSGKFQFLVESYMIRIVFTDLGIENIIVATSSFIQCTRDIPGIYIPGTRDILGRRGYILTAYRRWCRTN